MNDYFQHLIERSMGRLPEIRPSLPSLYEPQGSKGGREGHVPARDKSPDEGTGEDADLSSPAQRDASARERQHARGQGPIRLPVRDRTENQVKTKAGRAASSPTVSLLEPAERDEGDDGLCPRIETMNQHRREKAGYPEHPVSVLRNNDADYLSRETASHLVHLQKAISPDGEWMPGVPVPLPGGNAHDPPAYPVNCPHGIQRDPARPDPVVWRGEPKARTKNPSSGAVDVHAPERSVIRPLLERQTDFLMQEGPVPVMPRPAPVEQTIRVTIGRIDVRAVLPRAPSAAAQQMPAAPQPKVSLEEYLKKQWGGRR
jgi:hypothetical protein